MLKAPLVGRMPFAARLYLAVVAIAMLLLIAVHFAVQAWGQKQAEKWVSAWQEQYGAYVGEVRLRMLRGALSLHDVQWQSDDLQVRLPFLLLRGHVAGASSDLKSIHIRSVSAEQAEVAMSETLFYRLAAQQTQTTFDDLAWLPWSGLIDSLRQVQSKDMNITVLDGQSKPILKMQSAVFSRHVKASDWQLSGRLFAGQVDISSSSEKLDIDWHGIHAQAVMRLLGLAAMHGEMNGDATWQQGQWSGDTYWQVKRANHQEAKLSRLSWRGGLLGQDWKFDMHAVDWPLQMFALQAPHLSGRALSSAFLNAAVRLHGKQGAWKVRIGEGSLHDVVYQVPQDVKQTGVQETSQGRAWQLQSLVFKGVNLAWPSQKLSVKNILAQHGRWAVDARATNDKPLDGQAWRLNLPVMQFEDVRMGDVSHDFWLPPMQGEASLRQQAFQLHAKSMASNDAYWLLELKGILGQEKGLDMHVKGNRVPLRTFRDVLPEALAHEAVLQGDVDLDLQGVWGLKAWHLAGDVRVKQALWNRSAWQWKAEDMHLQKVRFASDKATEIGHWDIDDWALQAPLSPLLRTAAENIENTPVTPVMKPEEGLFKKSFWLGDWQVGSMNWRRGTWSVGQKDAVWLEAKRLRVGEVKVGQAIYFKLFGKLADGDVVMQGDWFPWQQAWVSGFISMKDALPFAILPWLQTSGLPVLSQGRITAKLRVQHRMKDALDYYMATLALHLRHLGLQEGTFENPLFTQMTGYAPNALLERIAPAGDVDVQISLQGLWKEKPLDGALLGQSLLASLSQKAEKPVSSKAKPEPTLLSNIRLHDAVEPDGLKHNERVRLRQVVKALKENPTWSLRLEAALGKDELNQDLIQRIRSTQKKIEGFLHNRGIATKRIVPVWPQESYRQGESTGIAIQAVK